MICDQFWLDTVILYIICDQICWDVIIFWWFVESWSLLKYFVVSYDEMWPTVYYLWLDFMRCDCFVCDLLFNLVTFWSFVAQFREPIRSRHECSQHISMLLILWWANLYSTLLLKWSMLLLRIMLHCDVYQVCEAPRHVTAWCFNAIASLRMVQRTKRQLSRFTMNVCLPPAPFPSNGKCDRKAVA